MTMRAAIATLAVLLVVLAGPQLAAAEVGVAFSIRPTNAFPDRPESFAYFSHVLSAGAELTDEALVRNDGAEPLTLMLYAADGVTAVNGGTTFAHRSAEPNGVALWITPTVNTLELAPGEEQLVPFTIRVPAGMRSGEYVGGLVLEAAASAGERGGDTQFSVDVIQRMGVAVVVGIPGGTTAEIGVTGIAMTEQDDDGSRFAVAVENSGELIARGVGTLWIRDADGLLLYEHEFAVDTVLPGTSTTLNVPLPVHLRDGAYELEARVAAQAVLHPALAGATRSLRATVDVAGGQPARDAVGGLAPPVREIGSAAETATGAEPSEERSVGSIPLRTYALGLLFGILALVALRARKLRPRWLLGPKEASLHELAEESEQAGDEEKAA